MNLRYLFYIFIGLITAVQAQEPLYNYTFTGGFQGWTTESIECDGNTSDKAQWLWVDDGKIDQGTHPDFGEMYSLTPNSGIVILNSDFLDNNGQNNNAGKGDCPAPQIAELISPTLDFSAQESVFVSFYQLYNRKFGYNNAATQTNDLLETATYIQVSNDGGNSWVNIPVNEDVEAFRSSVNVSDELTVDISSAAAGHSEVQVKFLWKGNYFFWALDDVRFYGGRKNDLAISAFKYPVSNLVTPESEIRHDTMRFLADVVNLGSETVDSAWLHVTVRGNKTDDRKLYFQDSVLIRNMAQNDTIIDVELPNYFIPDDFTPGGYVMIYRLSNTKSPIEVNRENNLRIEIIVVSEDRFRKTDRADFLGLGLISESIIGNYYAISENIQDRLLLDNINFSVDAFNAAAGVQLAGKEVVVYLLKIDDNVADDLSDWNFTEATENKKSIVGIGSYSFTTKDDNDVLNLNHRIEVKDMINLQDENSPIVLEPGSRYIAAVEYKGDAMNIIPGFSKRITYYPFLGSDQFNTMLYSYEQKNWFRGGIGQGLVAVIGMDVTLEMTPTEELLTDAEVKIFPNPTSDFIRVRMNLNRPQNVNVYLTDVSGRLLNMANRSGFLHGTIEMDIQSVPAGTYFLRVSSTEGLRTEKIVIAH